MRSSLARSAAAVSVAFGLVMIAAAADGRIWKPVLSDAEFAAMVAADAKIIGDTLAKGAPDKKGIAKIRAAALMIATYAQGSGDSQVGLRDIALRIGKSATEEKLDDVKKLVAELKPGAASGGAKTGIVPLHDQFELAELMQQFKPERGGGIDLEKNLQTFVNKRGAFTPAEIKNLIPLLLRTAVIAQPCEAFAPAKDEGAKTREQWNKWSQEMGDLASEAAKLDRK